MNLLPLFAILIVSFTTTYSQTPTGWGPTFPSLDMYKPDNLIVDLMKAYKSKIVTSFSSDPEGVDHLTILPTWGHARVVNMNYDKQTSCPVMTRTEFDAQVCLICDDNYVACPKVHTDGFDYDHDKQITIAGVKSCKALASSKKAKGILFVACLAAPATLKGLSQTPKDDFVIHAIDTTKGTATVDMKIIDTIKFPQATYQIGESFNLSALDIGSIGNSGISLLAFSTDFTAIGGWQVLFQNKKFLTATAAQVTPQTFKTTNPLGTIKMIHTQTSRYLYISTSKIVDTGYSVSFVQCTAPGLPQVNGTANAPQYTCTDAQEVLSTQTGDVTKSIVSVQEDVVTVGKIDVLAGNLNQVTVGTVTAGVYKASMEALSFTAQFDSPVSLAFSADQIVFIGKKATSNILIQADATSRGITVATMNGVDAAVNFEISTNFFFFDVTQIFCHEPTNPGAIFTHIRTPAALFRPLHYTGDVTKVSYSMTAIKTDQSVDKSPVVDITVYASINKMMGVNQIPDIEGYAGSIFNVPVTADTFSGNYLQATDISAKKDIKLAIDYQQTIQIQAQTAVTDRASDDSLFVQNSNGLFVWTMPATVGGIKKIQFFMCEQKMTTTIGCDSMFGDGIPASTPNYNYKNIEVIAAEQFSHFVYLISKQDMGGPGAPAVTTIHVICLLTQKVVNRRDLEYSSGANFKQIANSGYIHLYLIPTTVPTAPGAATQGHKMEYARIKIGDDSAISIKDVAILGYDEDICPVSFEFFPDSNDFVVFSVCDGVTKDQNRVMYFTIPDLTMMTTVKLVSIAYPRGSTQNQICLVSGGVINILAVNDKGNPSQVMTRVKMAISGTRAFSSQNVGTSEFVEASNGIRMICDRTTGIAHALIANDKKELFVFNINNDFDAKNPWGRVQNAFKFDADMTAVKTLLSIPMWTPGKTAIFAIDKKVKLCTGYSVVANSVYLKIDASLNKSGTETKTIQIDNASKNPQKTSFKVTLVTPFESATVTPVKGTVMKIDTNATDPQNFKLKDFLTVSGPVDKIVYKPKTASAKNMIVDQASMAMNGFESIKGATGFVVTDCGNYLISWDIDNNVQFTQVVWPGATPKTLFTGLQVTKIFKAGFFKSNSKLTAFVLALDMDNIVRLHIIYASTAGTWVDVSTSMYIDQNIMTGKVITFDETKTDFVFISILKYAPYTTSFMKVGLTITEENGALTPSMPQMVNSWAGITDFTAIVHDSILYALCIVGNNKHLSVFSTKYDNTGKLTAPLMSNVLLGDQTGMNIDLVAAKISCRPHPDATYSKLNIQCVVGTTGLYTSIFRIKPSTVTAGMIESNFFEKSVNNPPGHIPIMVELLDNLLFYTGIKTSIATGFYHSYFVGLVYSLEDKNTKAPFIFLDSVKTQIIQSSIGGASFRLIPGRVPEGRKSLEKAPLASIFINAPSSPDAPINEYPILSSPYFVVGDPSSVSKTDTLELTDLMTQTTSIPYSKITDVGDDSGSSNNTLTIILVIVGALILAGVLYFFISKNKDENKDEDFYNNEGKDNNAKNDHNLLSGEVSA